MERSEVNGGDLMGLGAPKGAQWGLNRGSMGLGAPKEAQWGLRGLNRGWGGSMGLRAPKGAQ